MSEEPKLGDWVMPKDVEHFRACIKEATELGKKQGRAEERKALMEGEPDGWCAWHPKFGRKNSTLAFASQGFTAAHVLLGLCWSVGRDYLSEDEYMLSRDSVDLQDKARALALADGWQIVPVKLIRMELDKGVESED